MHADDVRRQEVHRRAQHSRFGFDSPDSPAYNTQSVDHRGVRIRADERVRIKYAVLLLNSFCQILEVDLTTNSDTRWNNLKAVKCLHPPLQKLIARAVPLELHLHIQTQRIVYT